MKKSTDWWNKIRDLRHTLIQISYSKIALEREKIILSKEKRMLDDMSGACPC